MLDKLIENAHARAESAVSASVGRNSSIIESNDVQDSSSPRGEEARKREGMEGALALAATPVNVFAARAHADLLSIRAIDFFTLVLRHPKTNTSCYTLTGKYSSFLF